jgi:glycosyltransferase involved in cell wall biosynthesis
MAVSSSARIIFLNRFFYPDHSATSELLSDLVFSLVRKGISAAVITSRLKYENAGDSLPSRASVKGVDVWRVWTSKRGRQRLIGRSLDYLSFYFAAGWRLWRLARSGDIIVVKTDPPLLSVVIAPLAWLRRASLVNWLQDVFPEAAEALNVGGRVGHLAFRMLRPLRNWSLVSAKANVVVGEQMAFILQEQGIDRKRIQVVPNWSDGILVAPLPGPNALRDQWAPKSCFVVGYAGNLGRAHDVTTIIAAMSLLHERAAKSPYDEIARKIVFVFVGGGAQWARLEQEVVKRRLTNVRFHPYQPRERLAETLCAADVHLVSLNPKLEGLIVPSKFYGIAAAGRPTLFIGDQDGEIGRLVEEFACGFTVAPGDGKALANRILQLAQDPQLCATLGAHARAAFEKHWNKSKAVEKWEEVLRAVVSEMHAMKRNPSGRLR